MDLEKNNVTKETAVNDGYGSSNVDEEVGTVNKPQGTLNRDLKNRHMQSVWPSK